MRNDITEGMSSTELAITEAMSEAEAFQASEAVELLRQARDKVTARFDGMVSTALAKRRHSSEPDASEDARIARLAGQWEHGGKTAIHRLAEHLLPNPPRFDARDRLALAYLMQAARVIMESERT